MTLLTAPMPSSKGIVMGKAYVIEKQLLDADLHKIRPEQIHQEIDKFDKALHEATKEMKALASNSDLFRAHLELLRDPALYQGVISKIEGEKHNAQLALEKTVSEICAVFDRMEDPYMKERKDDIIDIQTRLMRILKGSRNTSFNQIREEVIIVAENLVLSDTSYFNLDYVLGFVTELGGVTSHVSILARSLELPALVGMKDLMSRVKHGDYLIVDASNGKLYINPDEATLCQYKIRKEADEENQKTLANLSHLPAVTLDGKKVKICANASHLQDIQKAIQYHIDGIGLFRSEYLYMNSNHFPTEEEQYQVYKEAVLLWGKELTLRTLDMGGDKRLPYFTFPREDNPFLGWRGIRISLDRKDIFKNQLRAILRASAFGKVKLMYPMIISLEELLAANELLKECMKELNSENIPYDPDIPVGIMIETPAAVMCADILAKHVDFFSIGSNDLTQYILAVDRANPRISSIFDSFHPAVIASIKKVVEAGHAHGIPVGICGEFAADELATPLLLGLGLDEFSMSARETLTIKNYIRNYSYDKAKECVDEVTSLSSTKEVKEFLERYLLPS